MNLKFICTNLSGLGGTETVLIKVLNEFAKQDNRLELILVDNPQNGDWLGKIDKRVRVRIVGKSNKKVFAVKNIINTPKDTHIISTSPKMVKLAWMLRKLFLKKYKIISWIHFSLLKNDMFDPRGTVTLADGHLAISSVIVNELQELGVDSHKVKLIFNPIERQDESFRTQSNNLLYAGRIMLEGQKNLHELLDYLADNPDEKVDFYGAGDEDGFKKYVSQKNIAHQVVFHGWTSNLWNEITKRPKALIMTSKYEGLPMIMLEAISRGIPVITSRFDGYSDVVREGINGFSYELGNIDELAEKVKLLTEIDENKISESIEEFYPERYYAKLKRAIEELVM